MDKVQFNQQLVGMRKVVKQAKVRVIHQLTRQIQRLQKKSGSVEQVEKNKRRAERLGAEIEFVKKVAPDDVTRAAITCKTTLEEVCKKPNASAKDRAMARLTNYGHIKSKVSGFQDMVEPEFYNIGKRKKRKLNKERAEARAKKEEEEDDGSSGGEDSEGEGGEENSDASESDSPDEGTKEQKSAESDGNSSEEQGSAGGGLSSSSETSKKAPLRVVKESPKKPVRTTPAAVDMDDKPVKKPKPKSNFFATGDADDDVVGQDEGISSGEDKTTSHNLEDDFKGFTSALKSNESIKDFLKSRTAEGKKTLDSVFMGSLSGGAKSAGGAKQKKNRAGQRERQRKGKMNDPSNNKKFAKTSNESKQAKVHKMAMVDRPNAVKRGSSIEKMVPGINCFRNKMNTGGGTGNQSQSTKAVETLHPSWEAKRKRKEQEAKPVTFTGKKITFDDD